jgi:hypothetical protein
MHLAERVVDLSVLGNLITDAKYFPRFGTNFNGTAFLTEVETILSKNKKSTLDVASAMVLTRYLPVDEVRGKFVKLILPRVSNEFESRHFLGRGTIFDDANKFALIYDILSHPKVKLTSISEELRCFDLDTTKAHFMRSVLANMTKFKITTKDLFQSITQIKTLGIALAISRLVNEKCGSMFSPEERVEIHEHISKLEALDIVSRICRGEDAK